LGEAVRRREFITLVAGAAVAWPLLARAQESGRTYRLGCLFASQRIEPYHVAFFAELKRHGFIEGQNLWVDDRGYGLPVERYAEHAREVAGARVDAIACIGNAAIRAAQQATKTIPILASTDDIVGSGLVNSLAKPDGNTTGMTILATELDGKRQEILMEVVPEARRVAALADSETHSTQRLQMLQDALRKRGVELVVHQVSKPEDIAGAIDAARSSGAGALNVLASPLLTRNRRIIMEIVAKLGMPAIYQWPETAEEGGLIGYGPRIVQLFREIWPRQLIALLNGAKIAEVPIEQPTHFELVVNLKTAKTLGLTIPESFLVRTDKVIE
jgi:putative tryptophan/tyrosine transport system substrate-binding protein